MIEIKDEKTDGKRTRNKIPVFGILGERKLFRITKIMVFLELKRVLIVMMNFLISFNGVRLITEF